MKRLIRNTVIWLAAGAIFACGTAAFGLVDLARTSGGNYPDRLLVVGEGKAELMGEEILLPEVPSQAQKIASAATGLIPPEWRLLFKTTWMVLQERLSARNDGAGTDVGTDLSDEGGSSAGQQTEAEASGGET